MVIINLIKMKKLEKKNFVLLILYINVIFCVIVYFLDISVKSRTSLCIIIILLMLIM